MVWNLWSILCTCRLFVADILISLNFYPSIEQIRDKAFLETERISTLPQTPVGEAVLHQVFEIIKQPPFSISREDVIVRPRDISGVHIH